MAVDETTAMAQRTTPAVSHDYPRRRRQLKQDLSTPRTVNHQMNPPDELTSPQASSSRGRKVEIKASKSVIPAMIPPRWEHLRAKRQDTAQRVRRRTRTLGAKKSRELIREGSRQAVRAGRRSGDTTRSRPS